MGRKGTWILGAALVLALFATSASAQVSVAIGIGTPHVGARVIVGAPPVYVVDPYYYAPYPYYEPYYYQPYAVPYGRVYYRSRPGYSYRGRGPYYDVRGRAPYTYDRGRVYYDRSPRYSRGIVAPAGRAAVRVAGGGASRGGGRYARGARRR
jgi:hypothetical protein